jgi:biotin operon repressor
MLGMGRQAVEALIARGGLPNAFRTDGHWRIPIDDLRLQVASRHRQAAAAVLIRRRRPYEAGQQQPQAWMTPEERRRFIAARLESRCFVRVASLSAELGVSQMTIRRDLTRLEAEGRLTRTHGGAMAVLDGGMALAPLEDAPRPPR